MWTAVDAYFVYSLDSGKTFSASQKLTSQNSNPKKSFYPHDYMGITSSEIDNKVFMTWTDYRNVNDSIVENADIYFSHTKVPGAPILSCPHNLDSVGTSPTLSWDSSSGANSYGLQVASDSLFSNLIVNVTGLAGLSHSPSGLSANSTYYWRVNASDTDGTSAWSSSWKFETVPPSGPQLTGSSFGRSWLGQWMYSPLLSWTSSPCNVTYNLYRYSCSRRHGCTDTVGTIKYSGVNTSYADSTWIIGDDSTFMINYYVKAGPSSKSNIVSYADGQDYSKTSLTGNSSESSLLPKETALLGNYPNPFNPTTDIRYNLPQDMRVLLKVYNILGQVVATLLDGVETAGYKSATFDATNIPSGVYFYRFQAGDKYVNVKKMLILK